MQHGLATLSTEKKCFTTNNTFQKILNKSWVDQGVRFTKSSEIVVV